MSSTASQTGARPPRRRVSGLTALGLGGLLLLLSILAAVAPLSRLGDAVAGAPAVGRTRLPATPPRTPPRAVGPAARTRYRIVGCVSAGAGAVRGGPARKEVAVGFDDGPWTDTGAFVTMLERAGVRASFFMIGRQVTPAFRSTLLRELRDGDVLGDHTWSHPELTRSPEVRRQLQRTIDVIRAQTGYTPCIFRPPYGAYDTSVLRTARSLGLATILWNDDPADWSDPGTGAIVGRVLAQVRPGSIIISHDGGGPRGQTLAAYPAIFAALHRRGYRVVTLLELLHFRPVYAPCTLLCDGLGLRRAQLPRDAIIRLAS